MQCPQQANLWRHQILSYLNFQLPRRLGMGERQPRVIVNESWLSLCVNENVIRLIMVIFAQPCEHTYKHGTVYFKWPNCTSQLHFNRDVVLKDEKKNTVSLESMDFKRK